MRFASLGRVLGVRILAALAVACALAAPAGAATYANGVDVSHYQGLINWTQVAAKSYRFTFAKATEGTTLVDATYPVNRAGAEGMGLRFGAYHFGRPSGTGPATIVASAIAQADHFIGVAQPQPGELPPVLDLETSGGLTPTLLVQWTQAWVDEVKARTGVSGFVYASPNFWKSKLGNTSAFAIGGYRLWVAHWTKSGAPLVPASNWGGLGWTFWQWTDCAKVPGFLNCVDGDRYAGPDPGPLAIGTYATGPPATSVPPTIVGSAKVGTVLSAVPGTWGGGKPVSFTYQWEQCDAAGANCVPISSATGETYKAAAADSGHALVAVVSASSTGGTAVAASPPTLAVGSGGSGSVTRPVATTAPSIVGTVVAGQQLTASVGTWTGSPTSFAYQWQRCDASGTSCAAIPGAVSSGYTLTPGDIGATLSLVVTATGGGGSQAATALATGLVAAAAVPAPVPGSLAAAALPAGDGAGSYTDSATGLVHVLVNGPVRIAAFAAGRWGDPSLVTAGLPTVYRNGPLTLKRLRDGSVVLRTRVSVASQAHLFFGLAGGATHEKLVLQPGSVPVTVRLHLKRGVSVKLRVAAVDPFKRKAVLLLPFRAP